LRHEYLRQMAWAGATAMSTYIGEGGKKKIAKFDI